MTAFINVADRYILKDVVSITFINGKLIIVTKDGATHTYSKDSLCMYDERNPSVLITD